MGILDRLKGKGKKPEAKKVETQKDVKELIAELKHEDEKVRESAAEALGKIRDKTAVEPLIEALKDRSWQVRAQAARALSRIEDERAVDPLIKALSDDKLEVRRTAADALSYIGGPSVDLLIKTFSSDDSELCRRVEYALWSIGDAAIESLIKALKAENWRIRANAAITLGTINYKRTGDLPGLVHDPASIFPLDTKIEDERGRLMVFRRQRDERRAVVPLIEALEDETPIVRKNVAYALGRIGDSRAFDPLRKALNDSDEGVRKEAKEALERLSGNPDVWARNLKEKKDYRALAAVFNSQDYSKEFGKFAKEKSASSVLKEAGLEAVDAIIEETAKEGVGCYELACLLAYMDAKKAVPLLKKLWDRGRFNPYSGKESIRNFVNRYPELHGEAETFKCALCGKVRPVAEMRGGGDKYFCLDTCWSKRGRIIGSTYSGALGCPFYSEGMCMVGEGNNTCSLGFGTYATTCYVYQMGKSRRF